MCLWCCRHFGAASLALVEASLLVKDEKLAAADAVLSGVQSDSPVIQLQAVLMRAQMAVTSGNQAQVGDMNSAMTVLMHAICLHARLLTVLTLRCMQVSLFVLILLHLSYDVVVVLNQCCSGIAGEY